MKSFKIKNSIAVLIAISCLSSCLKKEVSNIDTEETTAPVLELQFIENGSGSTVNSGLQYFAGGALTYPATDESDTATYNISLAGPSRLSTDLNVTVGVDAAKALDNYKNDSTTYEIMPDSLYHMISTSATIKAGERVVPMQIVFFPSKVDVTKSYILPIVIKDGSGHVISGNLGTIYFHFIGNPIAGAYFWNYYRWNTETQTGASTGWEDEPTVFVPMSPTVVKVATGYYYQIDYNISFTNSNGVLSDFNVKFDKKQYDELFAANGVNLVSGPTITVSPDLKSFEVTYLVYNGTAFRNIIDRFHK
jgi:hypothetical protein